MAAWVCGDGNHFPVVDQPYVSGGINLDPGIAENGHLWMETNKVRFAFLIRNCLIVAVVYLNNRRKDQLKFVDTIMFEIAFQT